MSSLGVNIKPYKELQIMKSLEKLFPKEDDFNQCCAEFSDFVMRFPKENRGVHYIIFVLENLGGRQIQSLGSANRDDIATLLSSYGKKEDSKTDPVSSRIAKSIYRSIPPRKIESLTMRGIKMEIFKREAEKYVGEQETLNLENVIAAFSTMPVNIKIVE